MNQQVIQHRSQPQISLGSPRLQGFIKFFLSVTGKMSKEQLRQIAEIKLPDLNCYTVEEAMKIVAGTAKNMGVEVEE